MHSGCADVFRRQGLGPNALRLWATLRALPRSATALALELGIHRSTVVRNLERLEGAGMVEQESVDVWTSRCVDLGHIAARIGTLGLTQGQKDRHEEQRYRFYLNLVLKWSTGST